MGDLYGRPAELEDDDEHGVVEHLGPGVAVFTTQARGEDKRKAGHHAHSAWSQTLLYFCGFLQFEQFLHSHLPQITFSTCANLELLVSIKIITYRRQLYFGHPLFLFLSSIESLTESNPN